MNSEILMDNDTIDNCEGNLACIGQYKVLTAEMLVRSIFGSFWLFHYIF